MSTFKIEIEGLKEFKAFLKQDALAAKIQPDITASILQLHNTLEQRVAAVFNAPDLLGSVMKGRSVSANNIGNTLLRFGLQYESKPIPLNKFPQESSKSTAQSVAPLRIPPTDKYGFVKWTPGMYSTEVRVAVRKGAYKANLVTKGYVSQKFFYGKGNALLARSQYATWEDFPTKGSLGLRAPVTSSLFGPPLSSMAAGVYKNDHVVEIALTKLQDNIVKAFVKYYK